MIKKNNLVNLKNDISSYTLTTMENMEKYGVLHSIFLTMLFSEIHYFYIKESLSISFYLISLFFIVTTLIFVTLAKLKFNRVINLFTALSGLILIILFLYNFLMKPVSEIMEAQAHAMPVLIYMIISFILFRPNAFN